MNVINLTIPFYNNMPVGNVWAYDVPFTQEDVIVTEKNGGWIQRYSMGSECGTRLMMAATYDTSAPTVGTMDISQLVNRRAVVIDIPKEAEEIISPDDIDKYVNGNKDFDKGDALIIRTGWGDNERYKELGDSYALTTPHFSNEGSDYLAKIMAKHNSNLLAIDVAYIGNCAPCHQRPEWVSLPPWQRPHWPSKEAKIYLRHYTKEKNDADWGASEVLHRNALLLVALCNMGSITKTKVTLTALPLFVEKGPGAPVTVVVIED